MAGIDMLLVQYRGEAPALSDLIAGQIQIVVSHPDWGDRAHQIKHASRSGRAPTHALAALPDVPSIGEFVPGYEAAGWHCVVAPKNTPPEIIDKLNREINLGLADPSMKQRIADFSDTPMPMTVADFSAYMVAYHEKWSKIMRDAGIKAE